MIRLGLFGHFYFLRLAETEAVTTRQLADGILQFNGRQGAVRPVAESLSREVIVNRDMQQSSFDAREKKDPDSDREIIALLRYRVIHKAVVVLYVLEEKISALYKC
jgi:hypothetical protein